jgi:hypothetical protein
MIGRRERAQTGTPMALPPDPSSPGGPGRAGTTGRDRREGERMITYWERKLEEFGEGITIAALDLTNMNSRDWSNRFLISVDPVIERSQLIMYGAKFARLLQLPERPRSDLPLLRQLPRRYGEIFLAGCADAQREWAPARLDGEVELEAGRIEQYRIVFIPVGVRPHALTCFAFGAFSNRLVEPPPAG